MMQIDEDLDEKWSKMCDEVLWILRELEGKTVTNLGMCNCDYDSVMISNLYSLLNPLC